MDNNGFEFIDNQKETTPISTESQIDQDTCSLPDWDLLPPFDEIERGNE